MKIGAHVSIAGGVYNAPQRAADIGAEIFQLFTRSPQGGPAPKLTEVITKQFVDAALAHHQVAWVVHTPYYINFASTNPRIKHGSVTVVRDELERASKLGATLVMTHLGSGKDVSHEIAQRMVIEGLATVLDGYVGSAKFCIEIAAGAGDTLGSSFEEIGEYISAVEKNDERLKGTIGVCFDTCHAFASGYDLRDTATVKKTMAEFDQQIGLERLKLVHANDSKFGLGEKKDRHEHIGRGLIGRDGFVAMMKYPALKKVDWYLETEPGGAVEDIKILKSIRGV